VACRVLMRRDGGAGLSHFPARLSLCRAG
jgi:hypothetical protein